LWNRPSAETVSAGVSEKSFVGTCGAVPCRIWDCPSSPSLVCRTGSFPCPRLKPASLCHVEATPASPIPDFTVSKKSSNWTWNWGLTRPVVRLSTRCTLRACVGLGPRLSPRRALGSHRGIELLEARELLRANTGHPKVCKNLIFVPTLIELNCSSLDWPSLSVGRVLLR